MLSYLTYSSKLAVALFEQWLVPKVDLNEIHLEDWATEHDHTLTVDISGLACISELHTPNLTLEDTLKLVTAEALIHVSVYVMNSGMV